MTCLCIHLSLSLPRGGFHRAHVPVSICPCRCRAAAFIAFRTARIPPLSDATHVPSHGNLTQTFDFDPQKDARRELLVAAAQARKAATAALHNKRVNEQRSSAIRMKTTIEHYTRSTINRRLKVRSRIES